MFAKYPRTPSDSTPNTPYPQPRRRLRCKMCRQELATREHMVDHGQVGPATPAAGHVLSPAGSRRPSAGENTALSRRGSSSADHASSTRKMSRSTETTRRPSFGMTPITSEPTPILSESGSSERDRRPSASDATVPRRTSFGSNPFSGLSMTPMTASPVHTSESQPPRKTSSTDSDSRQRSSLGICDGEINQHVKAAGGMSMSAIESDEEESENHTHEAVGNGVRAESSTAPRIAGGLSSLPLASPQELAAQIHPNLAALRTSPLISALSSSGSLGMTSLKDDGGGKQRSMSINSASPPLLMPSAKCSGYFVEPVNAFTYSSLFLSRDIDIIFR